MRTFAPSTNGDEGDNISKGLCHGITQITNRRLAFENNVRERAASRPLSPSRQANHTTHVEATEAAHNTSMLLEDYSLLVMRIEGRVTYMKLKGDQQLHLAEMARQESGVSTPECEGLAAEALESYLAAKQEASALTDTMTNASGSNSNNDRSKNNVSGDSNHRGGSGGTALPELHPLQVELSLRISSVLLYLLDRPVEAWEAGYPTYLAAAEQPTRLGARGLAITQALRDHLARVDVREIDEGYQHECGTDKKNAVIHGQCAREQPVEPCDGEWGFLRVFAGVNVAVGDSSEIGPTASDRLRALAQVKQARACLEGVTPTTRVLLGTMKHADAVRLALQQARRAGGGTQTWVDLWMVYAISTNNINLLYSMRGQSNCSAYYFFEAWHFVSATQRQGEEDPQRQRHACKAVPHPFQGKQPQFTFVVDRREQALVVCRNSAGK